MPLLSRAIAALILPLLVTPNAAPSAPTQPLVRTEAVFNKPTGDSTAQSAIVTKIGRLIEGAPRGSRIRISMYSFGSQWLANELTAAAQRGVSVQVIADSESTRHWEKNAYLSLRTSLGTNLRHASWLLTCPAHQACLGKDPKPSDGYDTVNHNKYFLFSTTSGSSSSSAPQVPAVIVQTSANLTTWDRQSAYNDALVVANNPGLLAAYERYFAAQRAAGSGVAPHVADYPHVTTAGKAQLTLFPRSKGDPIVDILHAVARPVPGHAACRGNRPGFGTRDGHTVVRVAMHQITRPEVARALWTLDDAGCDVQVVYRLLDVQGAAVAAQLRKPTRYGGIKLRRLNGTIATHSKYLLVEGTYGGRANQKIVFTGSHPYTVSALRGNDEALLRYVSATIHDAYRANFARQYAAAQAAWNFSSM